MRVLLLHPEDSFHGPWRSQRWDRVIDLGRAPRNFYDEQSADFRCPVSSIYDLAIEIEDFRVWRDLLRPGMGRVVDRIGIDWWDVIAQVLQPDLQSIHLALRLAQEIRGCTALSVSRPSNQADAVHLRLGVPLQVLQSGIRQRAANRALRYKNALSNLNFDQFRQVMYDKYDPRYRWRRKIAAKAAPSTTPVVLLPSAYSNVTKTALRCARLLPEQRFLLALARESASVSPVPPNVQTAPLAAFASGEPDQRELRELENNWIKLEGLLAEHPELNCSVKLGIVRKGLHWLRWGLPVRDAWSRVFQAYDVVGCLSADDSNPYTRIPLLLANRRQIPAVSCHHGALDARMTYKTPCFSTYLAQSEMEFDFVQRVCGVDPKRVRMGGASFKVRHEHLWRPDAPWIVFFTEPHEAGLWRVEAVYRTLLRALCAAARAAGKCVVLKLHPFESARHRRRLVKAALSASDRELVTVMEKPLSPEVLRNTWCAVTIESTVAIDCAAAGIPTFLCGWLRHAYTGYALQFAKSRVGHLLESPADLAKIPEIVKKTVPTAGNESYFVNKISPEVLAEVLLQPAAGALG